jgi:hypothetical protein
MYSIGQLQQMGYSPQEINKVIYSRRGFKSPLVQPNGALTTIRAVGLQIPDGPNAGKEVSVPSYIHTGAGGQVVNDPRKLYAIWKGDINRGRWPIYDNAAMLTQRDRLLENNVMQRDAAYWQATHPAVR